jgi:rubrerythrin
MPLPGSSRTRRELLAVGGATAGAAALAGCGANGVRRPDRKLDAGLLNMLLGYEHTAVAAYGAGARFLGGATLSLADRIVAQEREHARALERTVRRLGGHPVGPMPPQRYARSFPRLRDSSDALRFARDLERRIVRVYLEVLQQVTDARLRPELAAIVACEAEHLAVVSERHGDAPAPEAFVTGKGR